MIISAYHNTHKCDGTKLWSCAKKIQSAAADTAAFKEALAQSTNLKVNNVSYETVVSFTGEFAVDNIPLTNGKKDKITVMINGTDNKAHLTFKSKTFGTYEDDVSAGPSDFSKIAKKAADSINDILGSNAT
jgi:hypothetical protein